MEKSDADDFIYPHHQIADASRRHRWGLAWPLGLCSLLLISAFAWGLIRIRLLEQQILTLRQESSGSGPSVGSGSLSTSARDAHLAREIATLNEALNNLKKELESTQSQHLTREQELGTLVKFLQGEIQAKDAKIKVLESEKDLRAERR